MCEEPTRRIHESLLHFKKTLKTFELLGAMPFLKQNHKNPSKFFL